MERMELERQLSLIRLILNQTNESKKLPENFSKNFETYNQWQQSQNSGFNPNASRNKRKQRSVFEIHDLFLIEVYMTSTSTHTWLT